MPTAPPSPWPRLVRGILLMVLLCAGIAALLATQGGQIGVKLVYSFAIGFSCWAIIDGGRAWVQRLRGRHGQPGTDRVGWLVLALLIVVGAMLGPALGLAVADALTGGRSAPLWNLGAPATQITLAITLLATGVSVLVHLAHDRAAAQALRAEAAQRAAAEAQLRLLQSQLEPHMLFNTLANLRVLIGLDTARAQDMLDRLIGFLRSTLAASRVPEHALADEFARIEDYLALMQVRMGARLRVALHLPPDLAACPVPPLVLQPLVENAILHGLEPQVAGGGLQVSAARDGATLVLTVQDDGMGLAAGRAPTVTVGTGFGLAQVRERLATRYGAAAGLVIEPGPGGAGTCAKVRLPLPATSSTAARP